MIVAPYTKGNYDPIYEKIISEVRETLKQKKDDFLLFCCGPPGCGKSMLMLHTQELLQGDNASVDYIGLNRKDFANALSSARKVDLPRFCGNDEANISKRDALSYYNRQIIDLYFAIRGLQIFHWWNNPSLDMLDKVFIEERLKGVIYITTKDTNRPRVFYFFRKRDIIQLFEKYKNVKLETLSKVKKKYAYMKGWFRDYKGFLRQPYENKKENRMIEKVAEFQEEFGRIDNRLTITELKNRLGIKSNETIKRYEKELAGEGLFIEDKQYTLSSTGRKLYTHECVELFKEVARKRFERSKNSEAYGMVQANKERKAAKLSANE